LPLVHTLVIVVCLGGHPGRSRVVQGSVAISPAPFRGVLPLPISALRPDRRNPGNRNRAVPPTFEQFQYSLANTVNEGEAKQLYDRFCVPVPGEPLFQAAAANLNPWTEDEVDAKNPRRGRDGDREDPRPWTRLTIEGGWREVADTALVHQEARLSSGLVASRQDVLEGSVGCLTKDVLEISVQENFSPTEG
jgi:hypothetical protein